MYTFSSLTQWKPKAWIVLCEAMSSITKVFNVRTTYYFGHYLLARLPWCLDLVRMILFPLALTKDAWAWAASLPTVFESSSSGGMHPSWCKTYPSGHWQLLFLQIVFPLQISPLARHSSYSPPEVAWVGLFSLAPDVVRGTCVGSAINGGGLLVYRGSS